MFFFDDDYALYRDLLREACSGEGVERGRPLGAPSFLDRVAALTGRNPRPGKRGRPKGETSADRTTPVQWGYM